MITGFILRDLMTANPDGDALHRLLTYLEGSLFKTGIDDYITFTALLNATDLRTTTWAFRLSPQYADFYCAIALKSVNLIRQHLTDPRSIAILDNAPNITRQMAEAAEEATTYTSDAAEAAMWLGETFLAASGQFEIAGTYQDAVALYASHTICAVLDADPTMEPAIKDFFK